MAEPALLNNAGARCRRPAVPGPEGAPTRRDTVHSSYWVELLRILLGGTRSLKPPY